MEMVTDVYFPVCRQAHNAALEAQANTEVSERIKNLEQEVARHKEDSGKAQAEVDRLLEILREMENEKNDKDKKINELERWVYPGTASGVDGRLPATNFYPVYVPLHVHSEDMNKPSFSDIYITLIILYYLRGLPFLFCVVVMVLLYSWTCMW